MSRSLRIATLALSLLAAASTPLLAVNELFLDNGTLKIGVDLDSGGAITFLRDATDGRNIINIHDQGRQVQQSYYAGPNPYDPLNNQHPSWSPWPWNPIQAGDAYGNRPTILDSQVTANQIYVKTLPLQWSLNNVAAESVMESWYTLEGNVVRARARLINNRSDTTHYSARSQELPAVYTIGELDKLYSYTGNAPFTGQAANEIAKVGPPWKQWNSTENWAAYVDGSNNFGLGVYLPGAVRFLGGFSGTAGTGGPTSPQTGYIAPIRREILDHDIVYEYEYDLIVGDLSEIRQWVYDHQADPRPDSQFNGTRDHWFLFNATDQGLPDADGWKINVTQLDPMVLSEKTAFHAVDVPKIYIEMAAHIGAINGGTLLGQLFWEDSTLQGNILGQGGFTAGKSINFNVINDGQFHVYELDLTSDPDWQGLITQLRLDPVTQGTGGDYVTLRSISYATPIPSPMAVSIALPLTLLAAVRRSRPLR